MRRRRVLAVILTAVVMASGHAMWSAQAATRVFHDRAGDVGSGIDLTRVRVENGNRLILTAQHRDLSRGSFQSVAYYLDTDAGRRGPDFMVAGGFPGSDWNVFKTRGWNPVGSPVVCPVNMVISYTRDVTRFALARSCLRGDRGRVRVSLFATRERADGTTARDYMPTRHHFTAWIPFGAPPLSDRYVEFRSPSRNVLCSIVFQKGEDNFNRCDIGKKSFASPPRPSSCPTGFGWGKNFWVNRRAGFVCASEAATVSADVPTLPYGQSIRRGHIRCTSRKTGMVCQNLNTGHGYRLSRSEVKIF
jgi:Family of unknown function (DUF6636)